MRPVTDSGQRLAWGWVAHLRDGGTTTWRDWRTQPRTPGAETHGRYLPGAQQLELLRRLNLAGRPSAALAERVLEASAPGRGTPDLELFGAAEESAFGPRPIEPVDLPDSELIRVATGLIAEDLVAAGPPPPLPPGRPRPWRRAYRLVGDPWLADSMRAELVAQGRPPGGRGAVVAVVGTDLATMVTHAWLAGCFSDGGSAWADYCSAMAERGRVPRRVDLAAAAARWAAHAGGAAHVRIVLDPSRVAKVVGVRRLAVLPEVAADAAELARRVAGAVGLLVTPPRRTELLRTVLRPRLLEVSGPPPMVPATHRPWLDEQAGRIRRRLEADGYPVVGDLDALRPRWPDLPAGPLQSDRVLTLALDLLLRPASPAGGDES